MIVVTVLTNFDHFILNKIDKTVKTCTFNVLIYIYIKGSDAKASKCRLKFSSKMSIFIKLVCLGSVISL